MTQELKFLINIVKQAEEISEENYSIKTKGGESDLVTDLDVKIEKFLIEKIKEAYPTFDIVSEEENIVWWIPNFTDGLADYLKQIFIDLENAGKIKFISDSE